MTPTTHIAAACWLTAELLQADMHAAPRFALAAGGSLLLHLLLDIVPHGFIATPKTIFKTWLPTLAEVLPGPLILGFAVWRHGQPLLFAVVALCGILPDIVTTLRGWNRRITEAVPLAQSLHGLHRRLHWFEQDRPDGSTAFRFPNAPLLIAEACFLAAVLVALCLQAPARNPADFSHARPPSSEMSTDAVRFAIDAPAQRVIGWREKNDRVQA